MRYLLILAPLLLAVVLGVNCYNFLLWKKYKRLMSYLRQHLPEIHAQINPKLGPFVQGAYRAPLDFYRSHGPLDDPIAEGLFAEYERFCDLPIVFLFILAPIFIVAIVIIIFAFFYVLFSR